MAIGLLFDVGKVGPFDDLRFRGSVGVLPSPLTPQRSNDTVSSAEPPPVPECDVKTTKCIRMLVLLWALMANAKTSSGSEDWESEPTVTQHASGL